MKGILREMKRRKMGNKGGPLSILAVFNLPNTEGVLY
jgi:hypothetical protein